MLQDSDLYYGDAFGSIAAGYECDGLPITFRDGLAYSTGEFGSPTNVEIVAFLFARAGEEKRDQNARVLDDDAYLLTTPQGINVRRDETEEDGGEGEGGAHRRGLSRKRLRTGVRVRSTTLGKADRTGKSGIYRSSLGYFYGVPVPGLS